VVYGPRCPQEGRRCVFRPKCYYACGAGPGGHLLPDHITTAVRLAPRSLLSRAVGAVVVTSRRESVSKRLARATERSRTLINPFQGPTNPDYNDEREREIGANIALTLHRTDTTLRKAFKEFGLDPKNPLNWRYLLLNLADLHFKGPPRGSPPKWNVDRWEQFQSHVAIARARLEKTGGKAPSKLRIAEFIKDEFPGYSYISATTIRRYLMLPPPAVRKLQRKQR
jgi:hypothetical protein